MRFGSEEAVQVVNSLDRLLQFLNSEFVLALIGVAGAACVAFITTNSYKGRKAAQRAAKNTEATGNGWASRVDTTLGELAENQGVMLEWMIETRSMYEDLSLRIGVIEQEKGY
jgi:hypothetical protein